MVERTSSFVPFDLFYYFGSSWIKVLWIFVQLYFFYFCVILFPQLFNRSRFEWFTGTLEYYFKHRIFDLAIPLFPLFVSNPWNIYLFNKDSWNCSLQGAFLFGPCFKEFSIVGQSLCILKRRRRVQSGNGILLLDRSDVVQGHFLWEISSICINSIFVNRAASDSLPRTTPWCTSDLLKIEFHANFK